MSSNKDIVVSVIIPIFNAEPFIDECLQSVLHQTHQNLDVIIINDGSTDKSALTCQKFLSDTRVRFINRENRGLSATRQEGIDIARGKYFCTIDADDFYDLNFVEVMLDNIVSSGADMSVCEIYNFSKKIVKYEPRHNDKPFYEIKREDIELNFLYLCKQIGFSDSWQKMYRMDFVRNSGVKFFLSKGYNGNDLAYNHLLAFHCPKVSVINKPLLYHRYVEGSLVHRKNIPFQDGFQIIMSKIIAESEKLKYDERINDTLRDIHFGFLKRIVAAIIKDSNSFSEFQSKLSIVKNKNYKYCEQFPTLSRAKAHLSLSYHSVLNYLFNRTINNNNKIACFCIYTFYGSRH